MIRIIYVCLFALCLPTLALGQVQSLDSIAALVEDEVILNSEIEERLSNALMQIQQQGTPAPNEAQMAQLREQVIEQLVLESIQIQYATRAGIRIDDNTLNDYITEIAGDNGLSFDELRRELESSGSYELYRENLRSQIIISEFERRAVNQRIDITRQEIENYLRSEAGEATILPEFHLANILIEATGTTEDARRRELADFLYQRIQDGDSIPAILAEGQVLGIRLSGSDMGWRKIEEVPSIFRDVVIEMSAGEVHEPIENSSGFHLVQVLETRGGASLTVPQSHVRHILIAPNEIRTEEQAVALINELYDRIWNGEDFGDIARQNTDDIATIVAGGDLDWISPGQLPPEFEAVVNELTVGEISPPFKGELGWHIAQVLERREQDMTEENKRFQAEQVLRGRKYDLEHQNWIAELRDTSYVQVFGEEEDSTDEEPTN